MSRDGLGLETSLLDRLVAHVLSANLYREPRDGYFFCAHMLNNFGLYERLFLSRSRTKKVFSTALEAADGPASRASNKAGRINGATSFHVSSVDSSGAQAIGGWKKKASMLFYLRGGKRGTASLPQIASDTVRLIAREAQAVNLAKQR